MRDRTREVRVGDHEPAHTFICGGCGRAVTQDPPQPGDPHPLAACLAGQHQDPPADGYPLAEWLAQN